MAKKKSLPTDEEVVKFEIGAIINAKDEFDWKFGK